MPEGWHAPARSALWPSKYALREHILQTGLGEASHYNLGDAWHGMMYTRMGLGAMVLTATQAMFAWELQRHPDPSRP